MIRSFARIRIFGGGEENEYIFELRNQNKDELIGPVCLKVINAVLREGAEVISHLT